MQLREDPSLRSKVKIMDEAALRRALMRLSFEIAEKCPHPEDLLLVGICTRGVPLARMLAENIRNAIHAEIPVCALDISGRRDDRTAEENTPLPLRAAALPFPVDRKEVILVDDVLFTGRTVRAAIDALFSLGRPAKIRLAVLVDRGHRELPIRPDFVGKNLPTSQNEVVCVYLEPTDGKTGIEILEKQKA